MALKLYTLPTLTLASNTPTPITAAQRYCNSVTLQADPSNTAATYVGGIGTNADHGFQLSAGDSVTIEAPGAPSPLSEFDLTGVIAYCVTSGQKLRITYTASE